MPKTIQIAFDIPAGSFAQNAEWLVSDFKCVDLGKFRVNIVVSTASVVEYTVDSGTNWIKINEGKALVINAGYGFDVYVRAGDQMNFRSPTSGTTTLVLGRLDSIRNEG